MNPYRTIPHCQESDSDHRPTKALPHYFSMSSPSFLVDGWPDLKTPQFYHVTEAILSPAKYAFFQILGCQIVHLLGGHPRLSPTLAGSAKTGLIGGMILTLLYLVLSTRRRSFYKDAYATEEEDEEESFAKYGVALLQETIYSVIAAIAGSLARGFHDQDKIAVFALNALLGPVSFVALLFVVLGLCIAVYWSIERFRDWQSGYW